MNRRSFLSTLAAGTALSQLPQVSFAQEAGAAPALRPDFVQGSADAPVTLIEYASFTCPHCASFHETVYPQLKANYIDTGKVKFILREVYFDRYGFWAGMVAQCAGEMRYYGVADMLFSEQRQWLGNGEANAITENLRKIGARAGLSPDQINSCMNDRAMAESMAATFQANTAADNVDATPTLIIDGQKYSNMSYSDLAAILDAKLGG